MIADILVVFTIGLVSIDFPAVKNVAKNTAHMLAVWVSLRNPLFDGPHYLQKPSGRQKTEDNSMTPVILRPLGLWVHEYGNESTSIGNRKLEGACGRSLVVPGRVLHRIVNYV
jgi:hypothetical protein